MISSTWPILFVGVSTLTQIAPATSPADTKSTTPLSAMSISVGSNQNQWLPLSTPGSVTVTLTGPSGPYAVTTTPAGPSVTPNKRDRMPNGYNGPADPNKIDRMAFYNGPADPNEMDHMAIGEAPKAQTQTPSITLPPGVKIQPLGPPTPGPATPDSKRR